MDYSTLVQALVAPEDKVVSTVECSLLGAFKILALLEHPNWKDGEEHAGQVSPETREFVILVMDGRVPILSPESLHVAHLIPVVGNLFNCDIDTENGSDDTEFCVKITTNITEPVIYVKLARGHRSQNFIDEVFRAAQFASTAEVQGLSWLNFYEDLKRNNSSPSGVEHHSERSIDTISQESKSSDTDPEEDEDYEVVGVERESMAKGMTTLKGRDTIIKCVLDSKQEQFTDLAGYKVLIATWNVNGQSPGSICLSEWLARTPEPPDFYAIAFQELDLSKEAFLFNETPKEAEWL